MSLTVPIKQFMIRAAIVLGQARGTHEKSPQVAIDNDLNRVLQVVCPTLLYLLHQSGEREVRAPVARKPERFRQGVS